MRRQLRPNDRAFHIMRCHIHRVQRNNLGFLHKLPAKVEYDDEADVDVGGEEA